MPKIRLPALAASLTLFATTTAHAMGGGGVGAGGGGGFGLPLWQPPGAAYGYYYGPPPGEQGYYLRRHVRRAYGDFDRHRRHHADQ